VLQILDMADKLGAFKIRQVCLDFLAKHYEMLGQDLGNQLYSLEKSLLVDLIKVKAERDQLEKGF